jgi:hypothetical protein
MSVQTHTISMTLKLSPAHQSLPSLVVNHLREQHVLLLLVLLPSFVFLFLDPYP